MSLSSVLVDRARLVSRTATGERVEGTKQYATTTGAWFKARLFPEETPEQAGGRGGRRVLSQQPHVIVGVKDLNGDPIVVGDIAPNHLLEVDSVELGRTVWIVTSLPQTLRKRTGYLGHYFTVRKVDSPEAPR